MIAGLGLCSTRAPNFPVDIDHAGFGRCFGATAASNASAAVDQGKFMVFLQKNHHPVGEFNAFGLLWVKRGQRSDLELMPVGNLSNS